MPSKRKKRTPYAGTGPSGVPPEAMETFIEAIKNQVSIKTASVLIGRSERSVRRWLQVGSTAKSGAQRLFWLDVTRARAEGLAEVAKDLKLHAEGDYRAAVEILKRRDPDAWGDPGKRLKLEYERELQAIEVERKQAEARIAKAKAKLAEALAGDGEKGGLMVIGIAALLDEPDMPAEMRMMLEEYLRRKEAGLFRRRQLTAPRLSDGEAQA